MTQSVQQERGERTRLRDRTIGITLTLPQAVFGALFALFLLVWVFIFGIMLGGGYNPEDTVPELARVMPAPGPPAAPSGPAPGPEPVPDVPPRGNMNEVLQSRDLQYHDSLKERDVREGSRAAPPSPPPAQPAAQASASARPPAASQSQDQTVYTYVYQVAAFNNASGAEGMRKKLQGGGLTAKVDKSVSNGTTWYRIMVSFRGKPEDTRALRERLAAYGINAIILRGKAPVK